jgi:FKBP-type peptidyl-prolyl cis-trans isomerase
MLKQFFGVLMVILFFSTISYFSWEYKEEVNIFLEGFREEFLLNQDKNENEDEEENQNTFDKVTELQISTLIEGTGELNVEKGDQLSVFFEGWMENGEAVEDYDRVQPFNFQLRKGEVIEGWIEGLVGAKVNEKRRLTIPASLAYGEEGKKNSKGEYVIPPNETLTFEIKILAIKKQ